MLHRLRPYALLWLAAVACRGADANYVGSASCRPCHPDLTSTFYRNPHFRPVAEGEQPPGKVGCESCHGPGGEHIKQPRKANIIAFSQLEPKQALDNCLTCHATALDKANIRRSVHTNAEVACNSCHAVHKPAQPKFLLARQQVDLCYSCHPTVRAQFSMPFKHRVNEGFMSCTDCHNPHGTFAPTWRMAGRPRMVAQALQNEEPCLGCHVAQRGPFVFEHAAVRVDGCGACHAPHGSPNPRLLARPAVFTQCLECHNGAGSFGRQGDGVQLTPPSHNMADPRFRNCVTCHVRIHGSNTSRLFLR